MYDFRDIDSNTLRARRIAHKSGVMKKSSIRFDGECNYMSSYWIHSRLSSTKCGKQTKPKSSHGGAGTNAHRRADRLNYERDVVHLREHSGRHCPGPQNYCKPRVPNIRPGIWSTAPAKYI